MAGKNIGEWSEAYVFLKLVYDRRVDVADKDMMPIKGVFLKIISVIRNGSDGMSYRYVTGPTVRIERDGSVLADDVPVESFGVNAQKIWAMLSNKKGNTTFTDAEIEHYLKEIFADKISASSKTTTDITIEAQDYQTSIVRMMGFSCKSDIDAASTLFNASCDNTNFEYEVIGGMTDAEMNEYNCLFKSVTRKGKICNDVATADRMTYLKQKGFDLKFVRAVGPYAPRNLMISGGKETPAIVAALLKYYYYEKNGSSSDGGADFESAIEYAAEHDVAGYGCGGLKEIYRAKVSTLLYHMFTGMRLGSSWNGVSAVNGGYIVVKRDGSIVAYHSCITEEFKDFLLAKLKLEAPSAGRHGDRVIEKRGDKYYLKLALQIRFKLRAGK